MTTKVSSSTFQVSGSGQCGVVDDLTPTQKIWEPVSDLDEKHHQAFLELQQAVAHGDEVGMKNAFDAILYIEERQKQAHQAAREYALDKVRKQNAEGSPSSALRSAQDGQPFDCRSGLAEADE